MDKIYECANNFSKLLNTKYAFTIVSKRKLKTIVLDFVKEDFRHASGMRYIDDIIIENNPSKLVDAILNQLITDEMLEKSMKCTTERQSAQKAEVLKNVLQSFVKVKLRYTFSSENVWKMTIMLLCHFLKSQLHIKELQRIG